MATEREFCPVRVANGYKVRIKSLTNYCYQQDKLKSIVFDFKSSEVACVIQATLSNPGKVCNVLQSYNNHHNYSDNSTHLLVVAYFKVVI